MKLKHLQSLLEQVNAFEKPKVELEQYPTSPSLAAKVLLFIHTEFNEIEDRSIGDLGCGCGMLSLGSAILGAGYNVGFEIDPDAIAIAKANFEEFELPFDIVKADINELASSLISDDPKLSVDDEVAAAFNAGPEEEKHKTTLMQRIQASQGKRRPLLDTIIMNPPFGTRKAGIDMLFIQVAMQLCSHSIYSLHKTSTRKHIVKRATEWGLKVKVVAELQFDIPKMYRFHKKKTHDIAVDLIRFEIPSPDS